MFSFGSPASSAEILRVVSLAVSEAPSDGDHEAIPPAAMVGERGPELSAAQVPQKCDCSPVSGDGSVAAQHDGRLKPGAANTSPLAAAVTASNKARGLNPRDVYAAREGDKPGSDAGNPTRPVASATPSGGLNPRHVYTSRASGQTKAAGGDTSTLAAAVATTNKARGLNSHDANASAGLSVLVAAVAKTNGSRS